MEEKLNKEANRDSEKSIEQQKTQSVSLGRQLLDECIKKGPNPEKIGRVFIQVRNNNQ